MKLHRTPLHAAGCTLVLLALSAAFPTSMSIAAEGKVPDLGRIFSSKTALAIYADLESARQSGIGKTLSEKGAAFTEGLKKGAEAMPMIDQFGKVLSGVKLPGDMAQASIAEFAAVLEGERLLNNLESQQIDADFGALIVVRLDRTLDLEAGIRQLLETAEERKTGLRAKLERTRKAIGAAEVFDVPPEFLSRKPCRSS